MLKFIKYHMESIVGIEVYPLISFLIFFLFFLVLLVMVTSMRKDHIHTMESMPLDQNNLPEKS